MVCLSKFSPINDSNIQRVHKDQLSYYPARRAWVYFFSASQGKEVRKNLFELSARATLGPERPVVKANFHNRHRMGAGGDDRY